MAKKDLIERSTNPYVIETSRVNSLWAITYPDLMSARKGAKKKEYFVGDIKKYLRLLDENKVDSILEMERLSNMTFIDSDVFTGCNMQRIIRNNESIRV